MPISKRLRFEVLRRDGYACRYCGAKAPEVVLHVDHVIPEALGGSDEPSNLATSCEDCNSGKASTVPDAPTVADIDERDQRWRSAVAQAAQESVEDSPEQAECIDTVYRIFTPWNRYGPDESWDAAIRQLLRDGLPAEQVIEAARIARSTTYVPASKAFAYMMGICRRKLQAIHDRAREIMAEETQQDDTP
jgi:hypothetical protein